MQSFVIKNHTFSLNAISCKIFSTFRVCDLVQPVYTQEICLSSNTLRPYPFISPDHRHKRILRNGVGVDHRTTRLNRVTYRIIFSSRRFFARLIKPYCRNHYRYNAVLQSHSCCRMSALGHRCQDHTSCNFCPATRDFPRFITGGLNICQKHWESSECAPRENLESEEFAFSYLAKHRCQFARKT